MNDFTETAFGFLLFAIASLIALSCVYMGFAGYQSYQDSLTCRARTGLYGGCELKERESTTHLDIKGLK